VGEAKRKRERGEGGPPVGLRARALALYKPPFTFDGVTYVWDASGEMVLDDKGPSPETGAPIARVRGWGRISYLTRPEELHTTVGHLIAEALTEYWSRRALAPTPAASATHEEAARRRPECFHAIGCKECRDRMDREDEVVLLRELERLMRHQRMGESTPSRLVDEVLIKLTALRAPGGGK